MQAGNGEVTFIRKNGKVIPIKKKKGAPSKPQGKAPKAEMKAPKQKGPARVAKSKPKPKRKFGLTGMELGAAIGVVVGGTNWKTAAIGAVAGGALGHAILGDRGRR